MKDSTLNCLSPCRPHLDSTVFQNTDRQHGSYLWSKCAACSEWTSLSLWRGQHSKDGAQPWAVGHQCDLDQQRNAPWNRRLYLGPENWKRRPKAGFPGGLMTEWTKASELKGAREGTLSKFLWQPSSLETSNTRFPMEIFLIIPARHVFCFL